MKIVILKNNLKKGLEAVSKINQENTTLPILKNFLIETLNNSIKLSATNLELAVTILIPAKVIENGGITIPLNIFNSIINNIKNERINLEIENNNLIIKTDNYEAKIQGIKKEEFPIIPKISDNFLNFEISTEILKNSLISIIDAAQIFETKPEISSVFFNYQNKLLKIVATDSFRLAEKTIYDNQFKCDNELIFKIIIPLKTAREVAGIFKSEDDEFVKIFFNHNQILFKSENIEIISRLINGEFPDYQGIIPKLIKTEIILNKEELINALKLTKSFTDRLNEIKIIIKENAKNIEVSSFYQGIGENHYLIPAKIKGPAAEVVFNWRFLFDGLKNLDSQDVLFGINSDNKPAIIKSPNDVSYFYILMPIKTA